MKLECIGFLAKKDLGKLCLIMDKITEVFVEVLVSEMLSYCIPLHLGRSPLFHFSLFAIPGLLCTAVELTKINSLLGEEKERFP